MARRKSSTRRRPSNAVPSEIARHLAEHGFRHESMGGNTSAFRRVDGDGTEYVVTLADSQGHAPSKMTDAVDLFTAPRHAEMTERRYASVRELLHALEALDRPLQARASLMYSRAQAGGSVTTERGVSYTGLQLLAYVDAIDANGAPVGGGLALQGIPEDGVGPLFVSSADFDQLADGRLHTVDGVFYPRARWAEPGEQDRAIVAAATADTAPAPKRNGVQPLVHGVQYPADWPSFGRLIVDEALVRLEAAMRDEWPDFDEELAQRVAICLDEIDQAVW